MFELRITVIMTEVDVISMPSQFLDAVFIPSTVIVNVPLLGHFNVQDISLLVKASQFENWHILNAPNLVQLVLAV